MSQLVLTRPLKSVLASAAVAMAFSGLIGMAAPAGAEEDIDTTPPAAAPALSPAPNAAGWIKEAGTVTWNWTDTGTGIDPANCPATTVVSVQGTRTVTGACTDLGGNTATAQYAVKIDAGAPSPVNPSVSPERNSNGWYTGALPTVTWNWYDFGGSGIDRANCTATTTAQDADGVQNLTASCADIAGNVNTGAGSYLTVQIDRAGPVLAPSLSPSPDGATAIIGTTVTALPNATDATSGVATSSCGAVDTSTIGEKILSCTATDAAGNVAIDQITYTVIEAPAPVDGTPPTASPKVYDTNTAGWNKEAVLVSWNWSDNGGDPEGPMCPSGTVVAAEGVSEVSGSCTDRVGNTGSASVTVKLDMSAPVLAPSLAPAADGTTYTVGAMVTATPNATDAVSGIASSSCGPVDTSTAGTRSVDCTATDVAGNTTTASVSYTVKAALPYSVAIALPTAGMSVKAGGLVPVQFKLTGPNGQKLTVLQGLVLTLNCGAQVTVGSLPPVCAIYNPLTGNFITAVAIPKATAPGTLPVKVTVADRGKALAAGSTSITVK